MTNTAQQEYLDAIHDFLTWPTVARRRCPPDASASLRASRALDGYGRMGWLPVEHWDLDQDAGGASSTLTPDCEPVPYVPPWAGLIHTSPVRVWFWDGECHYDEQGHGRWDCDCPYCTDSD